ncbi:FMRFamide related propeptide [Tachypleus tridentatus]|uniref:FMRFamide related propeptide n=1 Tax=Tachypleus tridentatus TaxID=6853 RepID=UPI003FD4FDD9
MLLPPVRTSPTKLLVLILCHQMVFCFNHRFQPLDSEMNHIQETKIQHVLDNTAHDEENDVRRRILWSSFKDEILGNQHQFPNDRPDSNILSNIFKYPKRQSLTKYFSPQRFYRIPLKENRVNVHYEAAKKVKRQSPDNVFIRFGRNTESISKYSSGVTSDLLFTLLDIYFPFNLQSMEKFRTSELFGKSNQKKYYFSNPLKVKVLNSFRENKQKSGKTKLRALQTRNGNALVRFGRSVKEYSDKGFNSEHGLSSKMLNKFNCDEIDDLSFKTFPSVQPDYEFLSKNYVSNKLQKNYNTLPFIFLSCIKGLEKLANIGGHKDISRDTRKVICQKSTEKRGLFSDSNHEKLGPFAEKRFHKRNTNSDIAFDINSILMTPLRKSPNAVPISRRPTKSMVRFGREPNSVMFRKNVTPLFKFNKLVNPAARFDKTDSSLTKFGRADNSTLRFGRSPSSIVRSGRSSHSMVRFGRAPTSMIRFGRAPNFMIRYGRAPSSMIRYSRAPSSMIRYGRAPSSMIRYGRAPSSMIRYGRAPSSMIRYGRAPSSMIRYGRAPSSMIRYGRAPSSMIRYGRAPSSMIRYGRAPSSMIRFGRAPSSMIRFGRRPRSMIRFRRRPNSMIRFGRTQSFVKGLQKASDSSTGNGGLGRAPCSTIRFERVPNSKLSFGKYLNESIRSRKKSNMKVSVHNEEMNNKFIGYFTTPSTLGNFNEIIKLTDRYGCLSDKTCVDILKVGRNNHHFHNSAPDLLQSTSFYKNENLKHKKTNKNTPSAKSNTEKFYLMSP